jgi:hypothetical protein
MPDVAPVRVGDRVRITGILPDDPAPLEIGDEGTVDWVNEWTDPITRQFGVRWDSGRRLGLVDGDPYVVVTPTGNSP